MKKLGIALIIILLIITVLSGIVYMKNEREAASVAEKAMATYRSGDSIDSWDHPEQIVQLLDRVRTLDTDGAANIVSAARPYQNPEARERIESPSIDPAEVPELALLEAAGASTKCNLTGGIAAIRDNPFETEILVQSELIPLSELMVRKAKALETDGLSDEAERELLLLLSVGAHLEQDCAWTSMVLGLTVQQTALDALADLFAGRGEDSAEAAASMAALASSVEMKREAVAQIPPFFEMSLSDRGLEELSKVAHDPSLPRAMRAEALLALNSGYLFHINRVVLGPESKRVAIVDGLSIDDPVLAEVASKARTTLLEMPFSERRQSVTSIGVIE